MEEWDSIYKNNAPKLLGICRRYIKDSEEAEDVMHNAFITAMNKVDTYSGSGSFEGWLRKITINTALLHLRNNKKFIILENEPIEEYSETAHEEELSSETQRDFIEGAGFSKEELLEAIDQLPVHHKTVFNLYVIDGYKHKEIGPMLNISPGTSKSHLARARKKIQQLLFGKAEEKNKKRFLFFFFFPKQNPIDKLYKDAFENFEIQPKNFTLPKAGSKLINTRPKVSLPKKFIGNKTALIVSAISVLSIAVITFFIAHTKNDAPVQQQPKQELQNNVITIIPDTMKRTVIALPSQKVDSIIPDAQRIPEPIKKKTALPAVESKSIVHDEKKDTVAVKKPFVIHKSVIKHDTVPQKVPVQK